MAEQLYLWLGIIVLFSTILDIIITTLSPKGAGFFSKLLINGVWRALLWLTGRNGRNSILDYYPTFISVVMLTTWIALLWMSNSMILISDHDSILTTNKVPVTTIEKIYYTGYTLSTLGNGEFVPSNNFWRIYTNLLAYTGLLMITIGITYLVPLLQAEIQRRSLCLHISSFGKSVEEMLIRNWNGKDFSMLSDHFDDLRQEIFYLGQNHRAYPILHHSHSYIKHTSTSITICMLDEMLTIISHAVPQECWPNRTSLKALHMAVSAYLSTLNGAFIQAYKVEPPLPDFNCLREADIPIIMNEEEIKECYEKYAQRRRLLHGLLKADGWNWDDLQLSEITIKE
ncbi:potassium channel family protein [Porifericola rhodea]|uniref:potassium channel family protein n=1 Tax=Porifericola rhodea TaxID=930972 RepID=UPI002664F9E8|nr:potassium channel family protein [Porifericola rhodea]WKN31324.1 potassium channel family protein [Porifericola rhodea]